MHKLHEKQQKLLDLLKENINEPLSALELAAGAGIDSPGVFYHHLRQLEKKGLLKRNPDNPKDYTVFDSPEKTVAFIPMYGLAQCGPGGSILDDAPLERIPIASSLLRFPTNEAFIVKAKGKSMEPKIKSGDIVIARKGNHAEHGDIVVCVYDGLAMIKQYMKVDDRVVLHSFNHEFKLIEVRNFFRIEGVVKSVLQY